MLNKAVHSQLGKRAAERALSEQATRNIVGHSPSAALRFNKRRRLSASVRPPDESATQIDSRQDSTAGKHSPSTAHKARTAKVESPLERQHPFYWELHQMLKDPASTSSDFYELKRRMADAKASIEVELSQMPKSISADEFAAEVEARSSQLEFLGHKSLLQCMTCDKGFETKKQLTRHEKDCGRTDTAWKVIKEGGAWPCKVCDQAFETPYLFKQHLFESHSDVEVRAVYQRSIQAIIGRSILKQLRLPAFTAIRKGTFYKYIGETLNHDEPVDVD